MKHLRPIVAAALIALTLGATQAAQQSATPRTQYRTMHRPGHALEELLTPGAESLIVEKDQFPPMIAEPRPGTGELEWLTSNAPTVIILTVRAITPNLVTSRDWIESEVHATVDQMLKYSPVITQGSSVKFRQDGGEMMIRGTKVTAVLDYADGFSPKQRYLVFAETTDSPDTIAVQPLVSYLIDSTEHLVPLAHEGKPATERGVPLATAIERIKAALKTRP